MDLRRDVREHSASRFTLIGMSMGNICDRRGGSGLTRCRLLVEAACSRDSLLLWG